MGAISSTRPRGPRPSGRCGSGATSTPRFPCFTSAPEVSMLRKSSLFFALTCSLLLSACAGETEIDDLAGDEADLSADVASSSQSTYFTVRPDYRRCVSPLCGGKWVAEVNKDKTRCADGRKADECYVAELDLAGLGLSDDVLATLDFGRKGGVLLRGELSNKRFGSF